jgi:hypothetical protein
MSEYNLYKELHADTMKMLLEEAGIRGKLLGMVGAIRITAEVGFNSNRPEGAKEALAEIVKYIDENIKDVEVK